MLYFVDVSDTTDDAAGSSFKVKAQRFASTDGSAVAFTGGGTIALAGFTLTAEATGTVVDKATAQTLTSKTLTTPTIASMVNATHDHADAAGGGDLTSPTINTEATITAGAPGLSADADAAELVVQDNADAGISILFPDAYEGRIKFGAPSYLADWDVIESDPSTNIFSITAGSELVLAGAGGVSIGTQGTAAFDVGGDSIRIRTSQSPASGGTGIAGEIAWDTSYFYVCTATNTWERVALTGGY